VAIASVANELRQAEEFAGRRGQLKDDPALAQKPVIVSKTRHYGLMLDGGPAMLAALTAWRDTARSQRPEEVVDREQLAAIFALRRSFCDRMVDNYGSKTALSGNADAVWRKLGASSRETLRDLPAAYRPFVEARVTDWRRHRLFGVEPEFSNNAEDLSGQDCLISIGADELLETMTEHHYGVSVWCATEDLRQGFYGRGRLVHHCAV